VASVLWFELGDYRRRQRCQRGPEHVGAAEVAAAAIGEQLHRQRPHTFHPTLGAARAAR
jgi:hypothetical protein